MGEHESDGTTYLDTVYAKLIEAGIDKERVKNLEIYVRKEQFDTESMDLDLKIDNGGNIQNDLQNVNCIDCIKEMLEKSTSM